MNQGNSIHWLIKEIIWPINCYRRKFMKVWLPPLILSCWEWRRNISLIWQKITNWNSWILCLVKKYEQLYQQDKYVMRAIFTYIHYHVRDTILTYIRGTRIRNTFWQYEFECGKSKEMYKLLESSKISVYTNIHKLTIFLVNRHN